MPSYENIEREADAAIMTLPGATRAEAKAAAKAKAANEAEAKAAAAKAAK